MKLYSLKIEGFRRCLDTSIRFGDATFLIGENNVGKSSTLKAIDILLSGYKKLSDDDFNMFFSEDKNINIRKTDKIILTGEFRNVPQEAINWRGFKGRILEYDTDNPEDTGLKIIYRKTFGINKDVVVEMKSNKSSIKNEFINCKSPQDYIDQGINKDILVEVFGEKNLDKNLTKAQKPNLELINEIWDVDETKEEWSINPGGIMSNVISKLPKFILIPAQDKAEEIGEDGKNGTMIELMQYLFDDVRENSANYKEAQKYLNLLSGELDPTDEESAFGKMMNDVNQTLKDVFPNSKLHANADLNDPNKALKPIFNIQLSSNILTKISYQGTGMIRATVFSLLRFRENWMKNRNNSDRTLIIGFEEPEIYLHPNAANQLRDTIYNLATNSSQIICTTHSTYMIDLSRKPKQVLNNFILDENQNVNSYPFNISKKFKELASNDKDYIKMFLKMDDYAARVFFAKKVLIVEGDTEDIVLKETINKLPNHIKSKILSDVQIIKARGKAVIISLIKYLKSMNINIFVIHDRDNETDGAKKFNEPILEALGCQNSRIMLEECIEDVLGYEPPTSNKPYTAFCKTCSWTKWTDIPNDWRNVVRTALKEYIPDDDIIETSTALDEVAPTVE